MEPLDDKAIVNSVLPTVLLSCSMLRLSGYMSPKITDKWDRRCCGFKRPLICTLKAVLFSHSMLVLFLSLSRQEAVSTRRRAPPHSSTLDRSTTPKYGPTAGGCGFRDYVGTAWQRRSRSYHWSGIGRVRSWTTGIRDVYFCYVQEEIWQGGALWKLQQ